MIYTNGKVMLHRFNDIEALSKAVRTAERYLYEDRAMEAKFLLDDTVAYPCYQVPEGVSFDDLDQALRPNIKLRAINQEIITLPEKVTVTVKYYFDEDDLQEMGATMASKLVEKLKLVSKKKAVMADFAAQINTLEEEIEAIAGKHHAGHEDREHVCLQRLNYADGIKYFVDAKQPTTIHKSEPLEGKDFQLRLDVDKELPMNPMNPDSAPEPFLTGAGPEGEQGGPADDEREHQEFPDEEEEARPAPKF